MAFNLSVFIMVNFFSTQLLFIKHILFILCLFLIRFVSTFSLTISTIRIKFLQGIVELFLRMAFISQIGNIKVDPQSFFRLIHSISLILFIDHFAITQSIINFIVFIIKRLLTSPFHITAATSISNATNHGYRCGIKTINKLSMLQRFIKLTFPTKFMFSPFCFRMGRLIFISI